MRHVETAAAGAPVLLLHSSGLSGRQWKRLVPLLVARDLRTVAPDFLGQGASEPWPEPRPFSFRQDVACVVELLAATGPAHVIGHSAGGLVALDAALAAPALVRSLALYDPVAFGLLDSPDDADSMGELRAIVRTWGSRETDRERWLQRFVEFWGGRDAWGLLREEARAEFRRVAWVVREGLRSLLDDVTPASSYQALCCPVLLVTGEASPLPSRRVVERLTQAMSHARTVTVPAAGHMGPLTHPDAVNAAFVAFLEASADTAAGR